MKVFTKGREDTSVLQTCTYLGLFIKISMYLQFDVKVKGRSIKVLNRAKAIALI